MTFKVLALAAVASLGAGAASAAPRATDLDFMRAQRCRGLAEGLGVDAAPFAAYVKSEGRTRNSMVIDRAGGEYDRALRDARSPSRRDMLTAELNGACQPYGGQSYVKQGVKAGAPS